MINQDMVEAFVVQQCRTRSVQVSHYTVELWWTDEYVKNWHTHSLSTEDLDTNASDVPDSSFAVSPAINSSILIANIDSMLTGVTPASNAFCRALRTLSGTSRLTSPIEQRQVVRQTVPDLHQLMVLILLSLVQSITPRKRIMRSCRQIRKHQNPSFTLFLRGNPKKADHSHCELLCM